jgi:hypothetical protein
MVIIMRISKHSLKRNKMMNRLKTLTVYCAALLIAGCAVPLGEDFTLTRGGVSGDSAVTYISNYDLQNYVPIPDTGDQPVTSVNNRGDLEISVEWKTAGTDVPLPFDVFLPATFYTAKIRITAKPGYAFYSTPFSYPDGKTQNTIDDLGESTRTITVLYNSSDEARVTYITNYDLQSYVPVPMFGEKPVYAANTRADMIVEASWQEINNNIPIPITDPGALTFDLNVVYRTKIRLEAKPNYRFSPGRDFTYVEGATSIMHITPKPDHTVRELEVIYTPTKTPTIINDFNLTPYIPKPVNGATPVPSFAAVQYNGVVTWKNTDTQEPLIGPFQASTAYTAELILSPHTGYTIKGIGQNAFTHTGAETITNQASSNTVTIKFPLSQGVGSSTIVYDTILTDLLPKPINGITPVRNITGAQYAGTVAWTPPDSIFQLGTAYTAVLTLQAAAGYTFTGINQNAFSHRDAGAVTNSSSSGVVTVYFPETRPPIQQVMSFGPANAEDSALKLLKERSGDNDQVFIELPAGSEDVPYNVDLLAGYTSPAKVIIDGRGRTLNKTSSGTLITVSTGVILTLQNITLEGPNNSNNAPLIVVNSGGKLLLGTGAIITGNKTSSDAGGIWVNGGTLVMSSGAVIKNMQARRGGGVLVDANGRFLMLEGTLGGSGEGNEVSGFPYAAGGVLINIGSFDMYGGKIEFNSAASDKSAGGVCVYGGTFDQYGGSIRYNTALGSDSGGGVFLTDKNCGYYYVKGIGTMHNTALIANNTAEKPNSGGGVFIFVGGRLVMNNGTIRHNFAQGSDSGGGIFVSGSSQLYMYGGSITGNEAEKPNSGGGIYHFGTFELYGGAIRANIAWERDSGGGIFAKNGFPMDSEAAVIEENIAKAANSGGGLLLDGYCDFIRGTIKNNRAEGPASGGGIYFVGNNPYHMIKKDTLIKQNKATYSGSDPGSKSGGALYIKGSSPSLTITFSGTIGGSGPDDANTAVFGANGVYIDSPGRFILTETGTITGNTGGSNNYGVYVHSTNPENFILHGRVNQDNRVFLASGATIQVNDSYGVALPLANIECASRTNGITKVLNIYTGASGDAWNIINNVKNYFWVYNGVNSGYNRIVPSTEEEQHPNSYTVHYVCYGLYQE